MEHINTAYIARATYRTLTAVSPGVRLVRTVAPFAGVHATGMSAVTPVFTGSAAAAAHQGWTHSMLDQQIKRTQSFLNDNSGFRTWNPPV